MRMGVFFIVKREGHMSNQTQTKENAAKSGPAAWYFIMAAAGFCYRNGKSVEISYAGR